MNHQPQFAWARLGSDIKDLQSAIAGLESVPPEKIYAGWHFHNLVKCSQALSRLIDETVEAVG